MTNQYSIKYISSLLDSPGTISDGDQGSITLFRQTFPYFVPLRYVEALESHKRNPFSREMMSAIQPYMGDWIMFGEFLESGKLKKTPAAPSAANAQSAKAEPKGPKQARIVERAHQHKEAPVTPDTPVQPVVVAETKPVEQQNKVSTDAIPEIKAKSPLVASSVQTEAPVAESKPVTAPEPKPVSAPTPVNAETPVAESKPVIVPETKPASAPSSVKVDEPVAESKSVTTPEAKPSLVPSSVESHEPVAEIISVITGEAVPAEIINKIAEAVVPVAPQDEVKAEPVAEVQPIAEPPVSSQPIVPVAAAVVEAIPVAVVAEPKVAAEIIAPVEVIAAVVPPVVAEVVAPVVNMPPPVAIKAEVAVPVEEPVTETVVVSEPPVAASITETAPLSQPKKPEVIIPEVLEPVVVVETKAEPKEPLPLIFPIYTSDYFLQQGEKIPEEIPAEIEDLKATHEAEEDKSLMVMMSFSEWLLHFKNNTEKQKEETKDQKALKTMWQKEKLAAAMEEENEEIPENVFEMAVNSITKEDGLASESLAEIYIKQEKYDKAIEMYRKLSLRNPQKNAYFARKIEEVLKEKQS